VVPNLTYPRQTITVVKMGNFMIHGNGIPGYEVNKSREKLDSQQILHTSAWYIDRKRGRE
jgi:hypothetical protein